MSSALDVNDMSFEQEVLKSSQLVLVDFWAEWCGPCRMLSPIIEEVATSMANLLKVTKVNVDQNPTTPTEYGVRSIPTMILFKNGQAVSTKVGPLPKQKLEEWVREYL